MSTTSGTVMVFLAVALAAAIAHPGQIVAGAAFESFAKQTDRACPSRQLRAITPGDLSWEQEEFEDQLSPALTKRLSAANRQIARCAERNGLSCPTVETLGAMMRTNMLRAFGAFACAHQQP